MESLWTQRTTFLKREPLTQDITTEVCIIGAGISGLLCGWQLQKANKKVVILEANRIASGQTSKTTAKITSQMGLFYHDRIKQEGLDKAKQIAQIYQQAIDEYERIITEENISCNFERLPAILYSKNRKKELQDEYEAAIQCGLPAVYRDNMETPDGTAALLRFDHQAQFDPLRFLQAIQSNLVIYEKTPAIKVHENTVVCERGTVKADWILFACHFPFINVPGFYFMKMHQERSYVLTLKNVPNEHAMFYGIDEDGSSFRWDKNVLLLGGGNHRTGENSTGGKFQQLQNKANQRFPEAKSVLQWSAQDCMTLDHLPYIGQYSHDHPTWLVITGFNKWGMINAMVGSLLLKDHILKIKHPAAKLFDSLRSIIESPGPLMEEGQHSAKGLLREFLMRPQLDALDLPLGHGGVVSLDDKKVGVYRNEAGDLFAVDLRCPHLGCQLEWNPDELSWDCPCHGSRFDYQGRLIDNPAQNNLEHAVYLQAKKSS